MVDAAVKIDRELLRKVDDFLKKNKYHYSSKKQVVDLAIVEFLKLNSLNENSKNKKKKRLK